MFPANRRSLTSIPSAFTLPPAAASLILRRLHSPLSAGDTDWEAMSRPVWLTHPIATPEGCRPFLGAVPIPIYQHRRQSTASLIVSRLVVMGNFSYPLPHSADDGTSATPHFGCTCRSRGARVTHERGYCLAFGIDPSGSGSGESAT
ncbi:hypothetical protein GWI33_021561 [Rhynchophorus ferrugineus]|uniref:Uncharacterized protein n=1 Tax=Rhynchophorus ferrugineus TaxID=354439 RepID=A0A834MIC5_RHYFE|nr:hypothetical protein GWI33_021561 [Rhynchophorus ferrugineus]